MSDVAIRVHDLGKRYRIGAARQRSDSLRDALMSGMRSLLRPSLSREARDAAETIWALRQVSLEVKHGDVLGLVGHNGAGKSTLLKILARITDPTEGEVEIHGRVGSLLEVGTGFHPDLTGRENTFLSGALLGMRRREIRRKFDEIVDFSGIGAFIDTPVKRYSSGMYMRLAFAVAAYLETEILLVDEVLAVGDAEFQKKCMGKMGDVARQGRTVVFVSHNLAALQRLCPGSVLIDHGKVIAAGPTSDVVRRYLRLGDDPVLEWRRPSPATGASWFDRVWLSNAAGNAVSAVATGDRVRIGIDFVLHDIPTDLQISIGLLDVRSGEWIFASSPQDSGVAPPVVPGKYRAFVEFPDETLMPRDYAVRTVLWTPHGGALESLDPLTFSATPTASLSNSTPGGRVGLIALRCLWSIKPVMVGADEASANATRV